MQTDRYLVLLGGLRSGKSSLIELITGEGMRGKWKNNQFREVVTSKGRVRFFEPDWLDRDDLCLNLLREQSPNTFFIIVIDVTKRDVFEGELAGLKELSEYLSHWSYSLFGNSMVAFIHTDKQTAQSNKLEEDFNGILQLVDYRYMELNSTDKTVGNSGKILDEIMHFSKPTLRILCYGNNDFKSKAFPSDLFKEHADNVFSTQALDLDLFHRFQITSAHVSSLVGDQKQIGKGVSVFLILVSQCTIFSRSMLNLILRIPNTLGLDREDKKYFWSRVLIVFNTGGLENPEEVIRQSHKGNVGIKELLSSANGRHMYLSDRSSPENKKTELANKCRNIQCENNYTDFIGGTNLKERLQRDTDVVRSKGVSKKAESAAVRPVVRNLVVLGGEGSGKSSLIDLITGGGASGGNDKSLRHREVVISGTPEEPNIRVKLFKPNLSNRNEVCLDLLRKQSTDTCFIVIVIDVTKRDEFENELVSLKELSKHLPEGLCPLFRNSMVAFTHADKLSSEYEKLLVYQDFKEVLSLVDRKSILLNFAERTKKKRDQVLKHMQQFFKPSLRILCFSTDVSKVQNFLFNFHKHAINVCLTFKFMSHQCQTNISDQLLKLFGDQEEIEKGVSLFLIHVTDLNKLPESTFYSILDIPRSLGLDADSVEDFWNNVLIVFDTEGSKNPEETNKQLKRDRYIEDLMKLAKGRYTHTHISSSDEILSEKDSEDLLATCRAFKMGNGDEEFIGGTNVKKRVQRDTKVVQSKGVPRKVGSVPIQPAVRNLVILGGEGSGKSALIDLIAGGGASGGNVEGCYHREIMIREAQNDSGIRVRLFEPEWSNHDEVFLDVFRKPATDTCFVVIVIDVTKRDEYKNELASLKKLSKHLSKEHYSLFGNSMVIFTHTEKISVACDIEHFVVQDFKEILSLVHNRNMFLNPTKVTEDNRTRVLEAIRRFCEPTLRILDLANNELRVQRFLSNFSIHSTNVYLYKAPKHRTITPFLEFFAEREEAPGFLIHVTDLTNFPQPIFKSIQQISNSFGSDADGMKYFKNHVLIIFDIEGSKNLQKVINRDHKIQALLGDKEYNLECNSPCILSKEVSQELLAKCHELTKRNVI